MNKKEAYKLLEETFHASFDENKYLKFINEMFNGDVKFEKSKILIYSSFNDYIYEAYDLGKYVNKKELHVLVIKLKKSSSLERARAMQRNFVADYLKYKNIDASLIAFCDKNLEDWRFSFVKVDFKINKTENGKLKTTEDITPVKRYSYLVGKNESNHTCQEQLKDFIIKEEQSPTLDKIESAFSVDNVSIEFFKKYKELFIRLKKSIDELIESDNKIKTEFLEKNVDSISFSKKLLGQIVFLYFLQKKGWLGVTKNSSGNFNKWGSGPKNFLRQLFNKNILDYNNFFNDILEPLFYEALAIDRKDNNNYYSKFKCKIPFLNGGLFEPINNYSWEKIDILIDNNIFRDIFNVFDRFNFTIKEDEPLDKEVAVDPEMLGKVFEKLLEVKDRKSKGTVYTPREIVHYMCQQSLIKYLETNLKQESVSREDIKDFVIKGEYTLSELIREQAEKKQKSYISSVNRFILPESIKNNYNIIDKLLVNIKIADPAVGSGAFPVGMMTEIVKCRSILTFLFNEKEQKRRTNYYLKRETIENSLYGVDIEPSAVDITKLRFWLSLIVDEENIDDIKPLPNLDYKIMCGNSLLDSFEGVKLFNNIINNKTKDNEVVYQTKLFDKKSDILFKKHQKLQKEYFNESNRTKKNELKAQIDKIEWDFIEAKLKEQNSKEALEKLQKIKKSKSKPFFIWELYFNDVFNRENPGFDVVIGNPPYIDYRKIDETTKKGLNNFEIYDTTKTGSIYVYFIELGMSVLRKNSILVYINPYQYLSADSGLGIRKLLVENYIIKRIVDVSHIKVFAEASTYTCINLFIKNNIDNNIEIVRCDNLNELTKSGFLIKQRSVKEDNYRIPVTEENKIISKVSAISTKLIDFCNIFCGTSAGGFGKKIIKEKEFFSLSETKKEEYNLVIQSSNILKYVLKDLNSYIPKEIFPINVQNNFKKEKIFFARMTKKIRCELVPQEYYGGKVNVLTDFSINSKFLISILNSSLMSYWYYTKFESKHLSGGYLGFDIPSVKEIPIKQISPEQQKPFIQLVNKILSITKTEDYLKNPDKQSKVKKLEKEMDNLVYDLYELTPEEIKIVEEFNQK